MRKTVREEYIASLKQALKQLRAIRERLAASLIELAALQQQYREMTDPQALQHDSIDADTLVLEGAMARTRAFIRALEWVLGKR